MAKFIILLLLSFILISATVSAYDMTYNPNTTSSVDVINSSYLKNFAYSSINNSTSDFPVIDFSSTILQPMTDAFKGVGENSGSIVFLVILGVFILMVYRNSSKITIPCMIMIITSSGWALLFPESATPYIQILIGLALTAQVVSWISRE
jgi:hypothetical protein